MTEQDVVQSGNDRPPVTLPRWLVAVAVVITGIAGATAIGISTIKHHPRGKPAMVVATLTADGLAETFVGLLAVDNTTPRPMTVTALTLDAPGVSVTHVGWDTPREVGVGDGRPLPATVPAEDGVDVELMLRVDDCATAQQDGPPTVRITYADTRGGRKRLSLRPSVSPERWLADLSCTVQQPVADQDQVGRVLLSSDPSAPRTQHGSYPIGDSGEVLVHVSCVGSGQVTVRASNGLVDVERCTPAYGDGEVFNARTRHATISIDALPRGRVTYWVYVSRVIA
jgi:hypothetical protein